MKTIAMLLGLFAVVVLAVWIYRTRSSSSSQQTSSSQPENRFTAFVLAQQDWIRVQAGSPESVLNAVTSYGEVLAGGDCEDSVVVLSKHEDGDLVLTFPEKLPAYAFMNLIGWLNAPPDIKGVSGTTGWYTSPATGTRYVLQPDPSNPAGDTLVGYSSTGEFVEVYQPEIGMCVVTQRSSFEPEPLLGQLQEIGRITMPVPLEVRESFGNPQFVVTHSPNTQWY